LPILLLTPAELRNRVYVVQSKRFAVRCVVAFPFRPESSRFAADKI